MLLGAVCSASVSSTVPTPQCRLAIKTCAIGGLRQGLALYRVDGQFPSWQNHIVFGKVGRLENSSARAQATTLVRFAVPQRYNIDNDLGFGGPLENRVDVQTIGLSDVERDWTQLRRQQLIELAHRAGTAPPLIIPARRQ